MPKKEVIENTAKNADPYREPITDTKTPSVEKTTPTTLNLSQFDAKPGTSSGSIPTSDKNIADAKKEVIENTAKNADPYRELPGEIKSQKPAPLSKEFLSGLPTLTNKEDTSPKVVPVVEQIKNEGGVKTMASGIEKAKEEEKAGTLPSSTNSLKNISNLKNILSQKINLAPKKPIIENIVSTPTIEKKEEVIKSVSPMSTVENKAVSGGLNLSALTKLTGETTKVVSKEKVEVPKEAVNLMTDLKKDIEDLNKKIQTPNQPIIKPLEKSLGEVSAVKPVVNTLNDIKTTPTTSHPTENKNPGIFDDGVKFMDEKAAKPGFFSKIKKLFAPKKPVDVLVKPKVVANDATNTPEKITTMKSMMDNIKK
jgi:hypothetical protein